MRSAELYFMTLFNHETPANGESKRVKVHEANRFALLTPLALTLLMTYTRALYRLLYMSQHSIRIVSIARHFLNPRIYPTVTTALPATQI